MTSQQHEPRRPRVFVDSPLVTGATLTLGPERTHHLVDVLRLKTGAALVVFDGQGSEWSATLATTGRRATVQVHEAGENASESPLAITLWQGLSQGARMDACLRQGVELGLTGFRPVLTRRSSGKPDAKRGARKREHWQAIAISATEQSGRARVPVVHALAPLQAHLSEAGAALANSDTLGLVLLPDAHDSLDDLQAVGSTGSTPTGLLQRIELLIGPESGLDEREAEQALAAGFLAVRLGPRVLRTESAGPAAIAVLQARLGDLTR